MKMIYQEPYPTSTASVPIPISRPSETAPQCAYHCQFGQDVGVDYSCVMECAYLDRPSNQPDEPEEITIRIRWGGKDGKWRWLAEANDGQAKAGEERLLTNALNAASNAAYRMVPETP